MRIDTRFDLFDEVWYMSLNKAVKGKVNRVKIKAHLDDAGVRRAEVQYHIDGTDYDRYIVEAGCFATKDELLRSL